jgi:type II secretory pathway component PulM
MNPAQAGLKFFVLSGAILILAGVAQALARPPKARERRVQRYFNGATVRAMVFVTVGVLAIMVGLGVIRIG